MIVKLNDRIRVVRGDHIGRVGIVKSIDNTVIGSYPNQVYTKTLNIMSKNNTSRI
jgi:hypothetical protein